MCGIVGCVGLSTSEEPALLSLTHRGPDSKGKQSFDVAGKVLWLGHTRLAIQDLSPAGHQPMHSRNGRWWITFNGEIYNHLDLRRELSGPFAGHSDTETLVELIAERGVRETLPLLNGMFAFAALDTQEGKLYLARDPFGIKPLYYTQKKRSFAFASEVRALRALGVVGGPDERSLRLFLTLRYAPAPSTLWQGVNRLAPGHLLCLNVGKETHSLARYVRPVQTRFSGTMDQTAEEYGQLLQQAVRRQLLSDVPVGVLLSGGIDSALVAAMAREEGKELPSFSVGFGPGHPECELEEAAETARVLNLPFVPVEVTPEQLREALADIVQTVEEPLGTTSIMPMWYLVQRARQQVTVVLTGQGTDEPWGGYRRYQVEMVRRLMPWVGFWKAMRTVGQRFASLPEVMERGLRTLSCPGLPERVLEACALFSRREREWLIGYGDDGGAKDILATWLDWLSDTDCEPVEKMMRMDTRMNLADDLLLYGDKLSMAVALEARVPMLDVELVKFVESLPLAFRLALRRTKIVHKRMAEKYLPAAIVHRKKKGFQVPFGDWSRGIWKDWIAARLLDPGQQHLLWIRRGPLETMWRQHLAGRPGRERQIFALLMLALWWEQQ